MKRLYHILAILILFPLGLSAIGGWFAGPMFLHPVRRPLPANLIREADESFKHTHGTREDISVRAPDGALLRGWKVRAEKPNGSWVLLFHGVSDNRIGVIGQSEFLLQNGYSVVMMDSRSHGDSEGENPRSEEHTSELQSQSNLVCRLLLEKKKESKMTAALRLPGSVDVPTPIEDM